MTATPLADWIDTLRQRGIVAHTDPHGHVVLHGPATDLDHAWLDRHHQALALAVGYPDWWSAILRRDPAACVDLPAVAIPEGCAVRDCLEELHTWTPELVPYCADHHPDLWRADLPAVDLEQAGAA